MSIKNILPPHTKRYFFPSRAFAEQGQFRDNFVLDDKNYGAWFDILFELFKIQRFSNRAFGERARDRLQRFVPVTTAPKKRKRKGNNTAILSEDVKTTQARTWWHQKIKIKLELFKLRCTQDGLQQPSFYTQAVVQSFPTGAMPRYGREPRGRSLPATSTATITNELLHNIMPENASSSVERPVNINWRWDNTVQELSFW